MDYAVLYKKEMLKGQENAYVMRPCYVTSGFYDKESNTFLDEMNVERILYSDPKMVTSKDEYYIGNIYSEQLLLEEYDKNGSIENARINLLSDVSSSIALAVYDEKDNKVTILNIDPEAFKNEEFNLEEYMDEEEFDDDYEDDIDFDDFYERVKEQVGDDFVIVSKELLENLRELDDINTIKSNFLFLEEEVYSQIDNWSQDSQLLIISMKNINAILEEESIDVIKGYLDQLIQAGINALDEYQNQQINQVVRLYEDSIVSYNRIDDIDKMYRLIDMQIAAYEDSLKKETRLSFIKFYKTCINRFELMRQSTDINEIKRMYVDLVENTKGLLYNMMEEVVNENNYCAPDFANQKTGLVKKEGTKKEGEKKEAAYIFDYQEVRTKMLKRLIGRDMQVDAILTTIEKNDRITNASKRSAMIIAGTTGTGKTQTYVELAKALNSIRPVNVVDTNQLTEQGYVGGTIEQNVLAPLIQEAHRINEEKTGVSSSAITAADIELASHGIVILDEIDKRSETGGGEQNVNKSGVVHQLLKLMDQGTKYNVTVGKQGVTFDTSNLTIFASGAFQEYFESLTEKKKNPLGFGGVPEVPKEESEFFKYNEVDPNKLVKYGLDRQFVGRFNRVLLFPPHTTETLIELENNVATSNIQVEVEQFALKGINLVWEDGYIEEAAKKAYEMKTGGRALANIINRSLGNINCEINNRQGMFETIFVPVAALEDSGNIMLIKKDGELVFLRDLYKETEIRNRAIKNENKITRNEELYKKALEAYRSRLLESKEDSTTPKVKTL